MTVPTFVQPDRTTQSGSDYPIKIDAAIAVLANPAGHFAAHEQNTPNMTIRVDAGKLQVGTGVTVVAAQNTATIVAPTTNPRIDRVVIDSVTGFVSVITGAESASPTAPPIPDRKLSIAQVLIAINITAVTNSFITDERAVRPAFVSHGAGNIASNTALGDTALDSNTTGAGNTAVGINVLTANSTGNNGTAVGSDALAANTTGSNNTAVGASALSSNLTGIQNTAVGSGALLYSTAGSSSTAVGYNAMSNNTTGAGNVAVGEGALSNNTIGNNNVAVGIGTLGLNISAGLNTAVGATCLGASTGTQNTAIGANAGSGLTTGNNTTLLGHSAQASSGAASNEITLGNASVTALRCQVALTVLSDARDKKDIEDVPIGLDFINALRPVKFTWARRDGTKEGAQEAGFIAQELDTVQQAFGADGYLKLVYKENLEKLEATPGNLIPILVKAIQELKAEFDAYKAMHP